MSARLTSDQVRAYRERGYSDPIELCSPEEMTRLRVAIDRVLQRPGIAPAPTAEQASGRLAEVLGQAEQESPVPFIESRHLDSEVIWDLVTHPVLVDNARRIHGRDLIAWRSTFVERKAATPEISWHQDFGGVYGQGTEYGLEPPFFFSACIAITPARAEDGALRFIPGVKKILSGRRSTTSPNATVLAELSDIDVERIETVELDAGEMFFFSDRALHFSPSSDSGRRRLFLFVRITHASVQVRFHFPGQLVVLLCGEDVVGANQLAERPVSAGSTGSSERGSTP